MQSALMRTLMICTLVFSCSTQEKNVLQWPEKPVRSDSGGGGASVGIGKLTLVWEQTIGTADSFDIYFVADKLKLKGSAKVASITAGTESKQSYTVTPQQIRAAEAAAVVGNQKCFYIVALSGGTPSDPSEAICVALGDQ